MTRILLIGLAGALGTLTRYFVGLGAGRWLGTAFPYGTLIVNVVGCFLIAAIAHVAASTTMISPPLPDAHDRLHGWPHDVFELQLGDDRLPS